MERLKEFVQPSAESLLRREEEKHTETYLAGLLSDLERKNVESIAYRADRLYLLQEWARDRRRRKKCGVPREVRFRTRHALALEMLDRRGEQLPHA